MRVCVREWKAGKPEETVRLDVTETRLEQEVNRQPQQYRMNGKGRREDAHQAMNCMNVECVYVRRWGIGVGQNRVARMALNAPRYAAVEALRADMGLSTFRERHIKATLRYKVRLERLENTRIARNILRSYALN